MTQVEAIKSLVEMAQDRLATIDGEWDEADPESQGSESGASQ